MPTSCSATSTPTISTAAPCGSTRRPPRDAIARRIGEPLGLDAGEAAWGIHRLANANMERAMRIVSVERGRDPAQVRARRFRRRRAAARGTFGTRARHPQVIVPYGAGVGSAIGMLEANSKLDASLTRVLRLTAGAEAQIEDIYRQLDARVLADLERLGAAAQPTITRFAYLRYAGQGHDIRVDLPRFPVRPGYAAEVAARFEAAYQAKYGYRQPGAVVEAVDWYILASVANAGAGSHRANSWKSLASGSFRRAARKAYFPEAGGYAECAVIDRSALARRRGHRGPRHHRGGRGHHPAAAALDRGVSPRGHLVITLGEG